VLYAQSTVKLTGTGAVTIPDSQPGETQFGYKYGAGVGYEFDSGVGFRAEWEHYHTADGMGGNLNTNTFTASVLYRFQ
jgi:opacity protein-like surface antigen